MYILGLAHWHMLHIAQASFLLSWIGNINVQLIEIVAHDQAIIIEETEPCMPPPLIIDCIGNLAGYPTV